MTGWFVGFGYYAIAIEPYYAHGGKKMHKRGTPLSFGSCPPVYVSLMYVIKKAH